MPPFVKLFLKPVWVGKIHGVGVYATHSTQGHLTQIFPTFPNTIVNLDFYMKTDSGLSWVSNDR